MSMQPEKAPILSEPGKAFIIHCNTLIQRLNQEMTATAQDVLAPGAGPLTQADPGLENTIDAMGKIIAAAYIAERVQAVLQGVVAVHDGPVVVDLHYLPQAAVEERTRREVDEQTQAIAEQTGIRFPDDSQSQAMLENVLSTASSGGEQRGRVLLLQSLSGSVPLNVRGGILQTPVYQNARLTESTDMTILLPTNIEGVVFEVDLDDQGNIASEKLRIS